ncbi:MAG: type II toxin-antitoxin system VapC family toxin [Candidatus Heimdallarchaeota archaeon]
MAPEEIIVLDASVILKWFVEEEWSEIAANIKSEYSKGKFTIAVPSLVFYEVANVLRYKTEFGLKDVTVALTSLYALQFEIWGFENILARKTIELAYNYGITIFDAAYLGLAALKECRIYTVDEVLVKKTKDFNYMAHIREWES